MAHFLSTVFFGRNFHQAKRSSLFLHPYSVCLPGQDYSCIPVLSEVQTVVDGIPYQSAEANFAFRHLSLFHPRPPCSTLYCPSGEYPLVDLSFIYLPQLSNPGRPYQKIRSARIFSGIQTPRTLFSEERPGL